ncbi:MAG: hypothetical protein BGO76_01650 [Caedibacter sp. 38-128]|nr:hypothetical protein [Holosporales bacterium]OJX05120.1 MAG: hypothetical protein BGO76_01650 [Caedibacter sp. 38-128]
MYSPHTSSSLLKLRPIMKSVIREDLVALTKDYRAAVVLNQLIYWAKRVYDFDQFLEEEYSRNPECNVAFRHGWIIKTAQDLSNETLLGFSRQTMRIILRKFIELGVIEESYIANNKWDKTTKYRLNLVKLQESLFALGYPLSDFTLAENPHNSRMLSSQHSEVDFRPPSVKKSANNIDKRLHTESIKDISPSPTSSSFESAGEEKENIANEMKEIWKEEIGSLEISQLTPSLILSLYQAFQSLFGSSLVTWRSYCRKIASSKFLMGEGGNKHFQKPWLTWAIKAETYQKIESGQFTLGDRIAFLPEAQSQENKAEKEEELRQEIFSSSYHPLWKKVCLLLTDKLEVSLIRQWLLEMDIVSYTQEEVCIKAPTLFTRDWVNKNLKSQLLSALEEVLGHPVNRLKIEVSQNSGTLPMSELVEGGSPNSSPSTSLSNPSFDAPSASNAEEHSVPQSSPLTYPSSLNAAGSFSRKLHIKYNDHKLNGVSA